MFSVIRNFILLMFLALPFGLYAADPLATQSSTASGVTMSITPQNLQGSTWEFTVVLDTYSQDLKDDLVKNAALVKSDGTQVRPVGW